MHGRDGKRLFDLAGESHRNGSETGVADFISQNELPLWSFTQSPLSTK
jgi:hypothetical protein